jgi:hypothetical protein
VEGPVDIYLTLDGQELFYIEVKTTKDPNCSGTFYLSPNEFCYFQTYGNNVLLVRVLLDEKGEFWKAADLIQNPFQAIVEKCLTMKGVPGLWQMVCSPEGKEITKTDWLVVINYISGLVEPKLATNSQN